MRADWALWRTAQALRYLTQCHYGGHGVHSPLLYALTQQVLRPVRLSPALEARFDAIEQLRRQLLRDPRVLELDDYGAGPSGVGTVQPGARVGVSAAHPAGSAPVGAEPARRRRAVSALALTGARRRDAGARLARLVQFIQPQRPLELGTQLGLSALYLAAALPPGVALTTVEGAGALASLARTHAAQFAAPVQVHHSTFAQFLAVQATPWDFVLLDGHHDAAATLHYVERLLTQVADGACLVIDDIRWSPDMLTAWQQLQAHPQLTITVDLFGMGLAFVRRAQPKQHLVLWGGLW